MTTRDETSVVPGRMWTSAGSSVVIDYDSHSRTEYAARWDLPTGLGEMGVDDTRTVTKAGTVRIAAVPFTTGSDSVSDHLKYAAVSRTTFSMPESGSLEFSVDIVAATPGTQPGRVIHGSYTDTPNGGRPYAAATLEGQQAALAFTMSNLETGQDFAWFVSGTSVLALIERLPSSVREPSVAVGDASYVDLTKAHTQIVRSAAIAPGKKNNFSLLYRRNSQQSTVDFLLNDELFARVDHVGIPLDTQGVPYSGVYSSYHRAPGEEVKESMDTFRIGHGLRTMLDAFPFQHADAPELAVSIPRDERLFGQGAHGEFSGFEVTTI